jgi:monofunctional glycosyltransferase
VPQNFARRKPPARKRAASRFWLRTLLLAVTGAVLLFYAVVIVCLIALRWVNPETTAVQAEQHIAALLHGQPFQKRYVFMPSNRISLPFQHAVISAEDARFYQHHGFDWRQIQVAAAEDAEGKRLRGASTLDQQLVKNLFLTNSRWFLRKAVEATIVPPAEILLGKRRILELYLNVVEWGPGVYGAEAAAQYYYRVPASAINREQGARLAALLPAPDRRRPGTVTNYALRILERMRQVGW